MSEGACSATKTLLQGSGALSPVGTGLGVRFWSYLVQNLYFNHTIVI